MVDNKKLKVVMLAYEDWAGITYKMRCAINRYSDKYEATQIAFNPNHCAFDGEHVLDRKKVGDVAFANGILQSADVIILMEYDLTTYTGTYSANGKIQSCRMPVADLSPFLLPLRFNRCIWYGVGGNYRGMQHDHIFDKYRFRIVSTPDMLARPDDIYIPAPFDTDAIVPPINQLSAGGNVVLCHSPLGRERKGTAIIEQSFKRLAAGYRNVSYDIIENVSWKDCMDRKRKTNIFVDQMGTFHILGYSSIESAALGCAVVTNKDADSDNPALSANPNNLYDILAYLITNPKLIEKNGMDMRDWVVLNHSYRVVYDKIKPLLDTITGDA